MGKNAIMELTNGARVQAVVIVDADGNILTPGGGSLSSKTVTFTLQDGDNTVTHSLGVVPVGFCTKTSAGAYVATTGSDGGSTTQFNVNLSGGGPLTDALVIFYYNA